MLTFSEFCDCVRAAVPEFTKYWLNSRQEDAVKAAPSPPVFIVAGPGTGKTAVLALRALKLILVDGLVPKGVIATTFTRKASAELRSRILLWGYATIQEAIRRAQQAGDRTRLEWLNSLDVNDIETGTLDSIAEQMLSDDRQPGEITPTVVESLLARGLLRRHVMFANNYYRDQVLERHLRSFNPQLWGRMQFSEKLKICHSFAQRVLHDRIDLGQYASEGRGYRLLAQVIREYYDYLRSAHLLDFALLESEILERLMQNRLTSWTQRVQALLVDEFQDTNYLQELIYYELCRRSGAALIVVGDDDQSIYRFRGATVEIFADFPNRIVRHLGPRWKPTRYDLVENYRSSKRIVQLFNHFIAADPDYQNARVPGKFPCIAAASWATDPNQNVPVLGMFRPDVDTLANDICEMLLNIFRGPGHQVRIANGDSFVINSPPEGDFLMQYTLGGR
jgi:DNA helicase-2/ATP-dependent DNA helicase PcrA